MDTYLLLLRGTRLTPDMSPGEIQAITERYKAWGRKLHDSGRLVASNKLEDRAGRVIRGQGDAMRITDGPYAETKDVVAGYFLVQAASYQDAVELSRDCPHLDFGVIEVRRIQMV